MVHIMRFKRVLAALTCGLLAVSLLSACGGSKKNYVILEKSLADEDYGIGFRKADQTLRDEVERLLVEMNKDGKFEEISKKWFNTNVSKLPDSFTAAESDDTSLADIKSAGKLRVGLDVALPPMGFRNEDGEIDGFDIDLAKEVCRRMGVEAEFIPIDWTKKERELDANKIDCIWNGYTISDERKEKVNMTDPYMGNRQVLVVMEGSPVKTPDDLKDKTLTLQDSSTASDALDANPAIKALVSGGEANKVADNVTALLELSLGKCDAVLMDETVAQYYVSHKNQIKAAESQE